MTTQPLSLSRPDGAHRHSASEFRSDFRRPAAALRDYALRCAGMRSHRAQVSAWLCATNSSTVEQLFEALAGRHAESTALLLNEYRRGVALASTLLLGAKTVMLASVARHAPGDTAEEKFQITVDAFLAHALPAVKPSHEFADAQLYWVTLRTVTKLHEAPLCDIEEASFDDVAGADVHADADSYVTAEAVMNWALERGVIVEQDHRALVLRYGGSSARPVREVAAIMGVTENKLESRLRRAMARLRDAVASDSEDLYRACIDARWAQRDGADGTAAVIKNGAAA